jgi:hypothetical protein
MKMYNIYLKYNTKLLKYDSKYQLIDFNSVR